MTNRVVFRGGAVFDGIALHQDGIEVAIGDGVITAVGADLDASGAVVIDTTGATVVPGVIDAHVHLVMSDINTVRRINSPFSLHFFEAVRNARDTLAGGVTTVRDAGGADAGLRSAIESGVIEGPRALLAINMISQTGGHNDGHLPCGIDLDLFPEHPGVPSGIADGVDEIRRVTRRILRAGADQIKVATTGGVLSPSDDPRHSQLQPDELAALVAEASAVDVPVMAHAQGAAGIANAIRAGVRSIEHGIHLDDECIELMLEHDVWLVPTLVAPLAVLEAAERGEVHEPAVVEKARSVVELHSAAVRRAIAAGVRLALGTDAGISLHGQNLRELELIVECGMDPVAAWRAATSGGAELLGLDGVIGRLSTGFEADIVVVDGNIADTRALPSRVRETWTRGQRRFHRSEGAR